MTWLQTYITQCFVIKYVKNFRKKYIYDIRKIQNGRIIINMQQNSDGINVHLPQTNKLFILGINFKMDIYMQYNVFSLILFD